jgi:hypothetical protein
MKAVSSLKRGVRRLSEGVSSPAQGLALSSAYVIFDKQFF